MSYTERQLENALRTFWRGSVASRTPDGVALRSLDRIMVDRELFNIYRLATLPPRIQRGGSGLRAVKRRAVRRPW